jgi:hypothetical protein
VRLVNPPKYLYRARVCLADGTEESEVRESYDAALSVLKERVRGKALDGPIYMNLYVLADEGPKR